MGKYDRAILVSSTMNHITRLFRIYPGSTIVQFLNNEPLAAANRIKEIYTHNLVNGDLTHDAYEMITNELQNIHPYLFYMCIGLEPFIDHTLEHKLERELERELGHELVHKGDAQFMPFPEFTSIRMFSESAMEYTPTSSGIYMPINGNKTTKENDTYKIQFKEVEKAYNYAKFVVDSVFIPTVKEPARDFNSYQQRFDLIDYLTWKSGVFSHALTKERFGNSENIKTSDPTDKILETLGLNDMMQFCNFPKGQVFQKVDDAYHEMADVVSDSMASGAYIADDLVSTIRIEIMEIIRRKIRITICPECFKYVAKYKACLKCRKAVYKTTYEAKQKSDNTSLELYNMLKRINSRMCTYQKRLKEKENNKIESEKEKENVKTCENIRTMIHAVRYFLVSGVANIDMDSFFFNIANKTCGEFESTKWKRIDDSLYLLARYLDKKENRKLIKKYMDSLSQQGHDLRVKNCLREALEIAVRTIKKAEEDSKEKK